MDSKATTNRTSTRSIRKNKIGIVVRGVVLAAAPLLLIAIGTFMTTRAPLQETLYNRQRRQLFVSKDVLPTIDDNYEAVYLDTDYTADGVPPCTEQDMIQLPMRMWQRDELFVTLTMGL